MKNSKIGLCSKYLKRMLGILTAIIIFYAISRALNYLYVKEEPWERILWHNFYEDNGKIDNLYLGSSHVYFSINAMELNKINGKYNFNLSSSSQLLNGSYYLLKEADKDNSLKHVFLELYYLDSTRNGYGIDPIDEFCNVNWRNTDYMRPSYNKLCYILTGFDTEKYIDSFLPFTRYRAYLNNWDYIDERIEEKNTQDWLSYEYTNERAPGKYDEYMKQGYLYSTLEYSDYSKSLRQLRTLQENPMGVESEKYLRKIIAYCKKGKIPITLFIAPTSELMLISTEHYDNYIDQIRKIAEECDVPFYDFNLAKEEYLPIRHNEFFRDIEHLNGAGASVFTPFFDKVVSQSAEENTKYFYTSYIERLEAETPAIYGLYHCEPFMVVKEASQEVEIYHVASNRDEGMEYKIELLPDEGEQYLVQDFAYNKEFIVPLNEHGICTVTARTTGELQEEQMLQINY